MSLIYVYNKTLRVKTTMSWLQTLLLTCLFVRNALSIEVYQDSSIQVDCGSDSPSFYLELQANGTEQDGYSIYVASGYMFYISDSSVKTSAQILTNQSLLVDNYIVGIGKNYLSVLPLSYSFIYAEPWTIVDGYLKLYGSDFHAVPSGDEDDVWVLGSINAAKNRSDMRVIKIKARGYDGNLLADYPPTCDSSSSIGVSSVSENESSSSSFIGASSASIHEQSSSSIGASSVSDNESSFGSSSSPSMDVISSSSIGASSASENESSSGGSSSSSMDDVSSSSSSISSPSENESSSSRSSSSASMDDGERVSSDISSVSEIEQSPSSNDISSVSESEQPPSSSSTLSVSEKAVSSSDSSTISSLAAGVSSNTQPSQVSTEENSLLSLTTFTSAGLSSGIPPNSASSSRVSGGSTDLHLSSKSSASVETTTSSASISSLTSSSSVSASPTFSGSVSTDGGIAWSIEIPGHIGMWEWVNIVLTKNGTNVEGFEYTNTVSYLDGKVFDKVQTSVSKDTVILSLNESVSNENVVTFVINSKVISGGTWTSHAHVELNLLDERRLLKREILSWDLEQTVKGIDSSSSASSSASPSTTSSDSTSTWSSTADSGSTAEAMSTDSLLLSSLSSLGTSSKRSVSSFEVTAASTTASQSMLSLSTAPSDSEISSTAITSDLLVLAPSTTPSTEVNATTGSSLETSSLEPDITSYSSNKSQAWNSTSAVEQSSTGVITPISCDEGSCSPLDLTDVVVTITVNDTVTSFTTFCSKTTIESTITTASLGSSVVACGGDSCTDVLSSLEVSVETLTESLTRYSTHLSMETTKTEALSSSEEAITTRVVTGGTYDEAHSTHAPSSVSVSKALTKQSPTSAETVKITHALTSIGTTTSNDISVDTRTLNNQDSSVSTSHEPSSEYSIATEYNAGAGTLMNSIAPSVLGVMLTLLVQMIQ